MNKETQAAILRATGRFIGKRMESLEPRFKALETRALVPGPVGAKGDAGERGEAGAKGIDGKDADMGALVEKMRETVVAELPGLVSKAVGAIPPPVNGKDGERGADGKSVTAEEVAPMLKKLVDEIPRPKDGDASGVILELIELLNADQVQAA